MAGHAEADPRPRWRKRRWWAAGLFWLALPLDPLALGPLRYAAARGWLPERVVRVAAVPAGAVVSELPGAVVGRYWLRQFRWTALAREHNARDTPAVWWRIDCRFEEPPAR